MPEKLHRCVNDVKGEGKSEDSAWAICNDSIKETKPCEICGTGVHECIDHPYLPQMETHNPLDIPFGYEVPVQEKNMNVKDIDEGGMGSGRQPDYGDPLDQGGQPGELIAFETVSIPGGLSGVSIGGKKHIEETVSKQLADQMLQKCRCNKTK
jgi:hypothetical protein